MQDAHARKLAEAPANWWLEEISSMDQLDIATVPVLSLFVAFNTAGAVGGLAMAVRLLSHSPDTLMQDSDTGVVVYGPEKSRSTAQHPRAADTLRSACA